MTTPQLLALGNQPRWHGNGFIQLDLFGDARLHVWSPATLRRPENNAYVHNHVWGMNSTVLLGEIAHTTYDVHPDDEGDFTNWLVKPWTEMGTVQAYKTGHYNMAERSTYEFPPFYYHETQEVKGGYAATLIVKTYLEDRRHSPEVLTPVGEKPYDAHQDVFDGDMWVDIDNCVGQMKLWARRELERHLA